MKVGSKEKLQGPQEREKKQKSTKIKFSLLKILLKI